MAKIYFKDMQGKKVLVEVSAEIAKQYRDSLREEWRSDAYESYYSTSLESITEAGHDFADKNSNAEELYIEREKKAERKVLIRELRAALPFLTKLQLSTIHKLFILNISQAEIAREEAVSEQAVSDRVNRLFAKLKKLLKKF
jgi:DNA-directed RNA polymerase specialized sigma24 family protein